MKNFELHCKVAEEEFKGDLDQGPRNNRQICKLTQGLKPGDKKA